MKAWSRWIVCGPITSETIKKKRKKTQPTDAYEAEQLAMLIFSPHFYRDSMTVRGNKTDMTIITIAMTNQKLTVRVLSPDRLRAAAKTVRAGVLESARRSRGRTVLFGP